jgi:uncharacterized protein (DUF697 family)
VAGIKDLNNVWNNVKEIDLRPLTEAAQRSLRIALVGRQRELMVSLSEGMRRDPDRPDQVTQTGLLLVHPEEAGDALRADLIILLLDSTSEDDSLERSLAKNWASTGKTVLVILPPDAVGGGVPPPPGDAQPAAISQWVTWEKRQVINGSVEDPAFLTGIFSPAVLRLLPEYHLALARQFPLFRTLVAHELITDSCFSNAAYALSTGLAEIVPIFDIPLNIADMFVLTKAQAFLAYRLGLALGLSVHWRDYVAEFGGVLGGGFLWRQVARSLIGLIPAWGIIPKVAVAYAGTYVVGNVVYHWYLTGRHVSAQQMRQLYVQAFARGKNIARSMRERLPKPKRKPKLLKASKVKQASSQASLQASTPAEGKTCGNCGKTSAPDAQFCQYCGNAF